ncbi:cytochrome c [Paracoccus sp. (in: a-proteobacteria)]|uniref:c-type cytochrome n=1 Tax=Paracoccus sp. TaxID=267 RepID=UPI002AFF58B9|nr:cytochrome c [Paracoccus sp. (in: a-proteobacteria)]
MAKLALLLVLLAGSAIAEPPDAARQDELRHMVRQDCGSCHGLRMTGGLGRPITAEALDGRDIEDLSSVILDGMPGTAMPGWRPLLTEDDARWIADYLLKETE